VATKEDILEQLVGEYLTYKGYFVRHNIKFLPRKDHPEYVKNLDSNHSDIDVLGFNPLLEGPAKVWAVSCKSWQYGFNPASELRNITEDKVVRGRHAWKAFRELINPKWSEAYIEAIKSCCGTDEFTYVLAVAKLKGDKSIWENHQEFSQAVNDNPIKIITFREMIKEIYSNLGTTLAASEVGRMLQMFKAADITL
jgi:hypothetical protein